MPNDPKKVVERGYDQVAAAYNQLDKETEWPRLRWLRTMLAHLGAGASVLDLGCGNGDPACIEIAKTHSVTGVDISQTQIDLARKNVPAGTFIQGDLASVDFPAQAFDAVASFYTLEHIPRREHAEVLKRIHGWLRSGGLLLFSIEAGDYDDETGDWLGVPMFISTYDPDTMRGLVTDAGFDVLETAIENQMEQGGEIPYLWVLARKR